MQTLLKAEIVLKINPMIKTLESRIIIMRNAFFIEVELQDKAFVHLPWKCRLGKRVWWDSSCH